MPLNFFSQSLHVSCRKQISQAAMLWRHDLGIALVANFVAKNNEHVAGQGFPENLHDFISRHPADFSVETQIGLADFHPFQALGREFHRGNDPVKICKQARVRLVKGSGSGERYLLKGNARFANLVHPLIIKTCNMRASVREAFDNTLRLENFKSFTQRNSAYAEKVG